jgi:hypothetical protein
MKNIQRILAIALVVCFSACEETNPDVIVGGDGDADLSGRQYANIDPPTSLQFLLNGTPSISIPLGKFEAEGTTINSVTVTKTLFIKDVTDDDEVDVNYTTAPVSYTVTGDVFTQTLAQLFADVLVQGNLYAESDLNPGDKWTISYVVNISGNSPTSDNKLAIPVSTSILFSCLSAIPTTGTWTSTSQYGAFGTTGTNPSVTITSLGSGNYSLTDICSGWYAALGPYEPLQPGNINDLCNVITVTGAPNAQFAVGNTGTGGPGSWNSVTGELLITWWDSINDIDEASLLTQN